MLRKNSGITLMTLVVTIIILLILAGTATFTGMSAIENSRITTFRTEMEMMKLQLNSPTELEKYKKTESDTLTENQKNYLIAVRNNLNEDGLSITLDIDGFKYFTKEEVKSISSIDVSRNLYINTDTKTIVSGEAVEYENKLYYMLEQLPNSLYNVETNIQNSGDVTFDLTADKLSMTISNIEYTAQYVNKGTIQYKLSTDENWITIAEDSTSKNLTFELPSDGRYDIRIVDAKENEYIKDIVVSKNWDNKVNEPKILTGMTPIKFNEATETTDGSAAETTSTDTEWYDYESKKWANAKTEDESMWVWIPRYAYKINSSAQTTDVVFLVGTTDYYYDENGQIQEAKRATTEDEEIDTTEGYTVHPAFTDESSINFRNGGWDEELTGIWVAKFEAGYASGGNDTEIVASNVNYSKTTVWVHDTETGESNSAWGSMKPARNWLDGIYGATTTSIKYPVFQGTTYSMNYINHSDCFYITKALTDTDNIYGLSSSNADSHLMKNSEWGAVSYLSKSKYGLEGIDIAVNSKEIYSGGSSTTKADGNDLASVYAITGYNSNGNEWNDYLGENLSASTTGNIYGIYDLSGGLVDRMAGIVSNGNSGLYTHGKSIIDEAKITYSETTVIANTGTSTKYVTIYPNNDSEETDSNIASQKNYEVNTKIYGDAVKETSTAGTGSTSWYVDNSYFPALISSFFSYGGRSGSVAGLFSFSRDNGSSGYGQGFRAVLVAK